VWQLIPVNFETAAIEYSAGGIAGRGVLAAASGWCAWPGSEPESWRRFKGGRVSMNLVFATSALSCGEPM
jgi:hypothetical protein